MMQVSSHLDKMNISFSQADTIAELFENPPDLLEKTEDVRPFAFYDRAVRLYGGGIVNFSEKESQGARLDLGGQALELLRQAGFDCVALLRYFAENCPRKRRTTRIDYCINVHGAGSPESCVEQFDSGKAATRFRGEPEIDDRRRGGNGFTAYFGSRSGQKRVVVYDKAAQLKLLDEAWTRVELRLKSPYSGGFVADAMEHNDAALAGRSYLLDILDFPELDWWNEAMRGDTILPRAASRHGGKFMHWMDNQVFRAAELRRDDPELREWLLEWSGRFVSMLVEK